MTTTALTNPLERWKPKNPALSSRAFVVALVTFVAAQFVMSAQHIIDSHYGVHASGAEPLFPGWIWASMGVLLVAAAEQGMRRIDEERRQNRLELLWSTPLLSRFLASSSRSRALRQGIAVPVVILWIAWFLGAPEWSPQSLVFTRLLALAVVGGLSLVLGTLVGLAAALCTTSRAGRWVRALPLLALMLVGPSQTHLPPLPILLVTAAAYVLCIAQVERLVGRLLLRSVPEPPPIHITSVGPVYRLLDATIMAFARLLGYHANPFFQLQRARALRRFARQPLWLLLAVAVPLVPLMVAGGLHNLPQVMPWFAPLMLFGWWMVGAGATQNSLRSILDQKTMMTLRLTPFDPARDTLGMICGRLYTLALAWIIGVPVWVFYACLGDMRAGPMLLLPLLCALLCFVSGVAGVRACCTNLINERKAGQFYSEGFVNTTLWVYALLLSPMLSAWCLSMPGVGWVPFDFVSLLPLWLVKPALVTPMVVLGALTLHCVAVWIGYSVDMARMQESLVTALTREDL